MGVFVYGVTFKLITTIKYKATLLHYETIRKLAQLHNWTLKFDKTKI